MRVNRQILGLSGSKYTILGRPIKSARLVNIWSTDHYRIRFIWVFSRASQVFGLPSTIRTCDLRLRRIRGCSNVYVFQWVTAL